MLLVEGRKESAIHQDSNLRASSLYFRIKQELPDDAAPREVWRETLGRACQAVSQRIGVLFDPDSEYARLLPQQPTLTKLIDGLNDPAVPSEVYTEDELLGWVYQYYNAEEKNAVYSKLGKGGKIERPEELAAASCLYTERYMVDFLLQNTLGSLWVRMHPETRLPERWPYYVRPLENQPEPREELVPDRVRDITLLDPAVGSGHFLVRAFDLLVQMYEEEGLEDPLEIPRLILAHNLHGIDIDLRAAQISALALYLKGCDYVGPDFRPTRINLVSADLILAGAPPASFLERYTGEPEIQELMKTLWTELRDAPMLGSLLHPDRKIDELLQDRRRDGDTLLHQDDAAWERFRLELLEALRQEFESESQSKDIAQRLFGENLAKTISVVEVLTRHYNVVVANPPYAGKKNLDDVVLRHVEREYSEGKRDLYTAFILRCIEFATTDGFVGLVAQQSWMFLRSFSKLRAKVLSETSLNSLAHLGTRAFEEIGGEVVSVGLFTVRKGNPQQDHRWSAFRLVDPKSSAEKNALLLQGIAESDGALKFTPSQGDILRINETPFVYWVRPRFFDLLGSVHRLSDIVDARQGLATADNERFLRFFWEVLPESAGLEGPRWFPYLKGGGYQKWAGLESLMVDWEEGGKRIKERLDPKKGRPYSNVWMLRETEKRFFTPGLVYTLMAGGNMGVRYMDHSCFDVASISLFPQPGIPRLSVAVLLNSRVASYLLRLTTQDLKFHAGYVAKLPLPQFAREEFALLGGGAVGLKAELVSRDPVEWSFSDAEFADAESSDLRGVLSRRIADQEATEAWLHSLEAVCERVVFDAYDLDDLDIHAIVNDTGIPAGWHPSISGYASLLPIGAVREFPADLTALIEADRQSVSVDDLVKIKDQLKTRYEAGPNAQVVEEVENNGPKSARSHIPTETFLEELSVTLQIHPVSVYSLLEEMRREDGLVSPVLMRDALEDFASVSLLRLLGYRWPEQDSYEAEHGRIVPPELVDSDGITPLVKCNEQPTAAERIRARLDYQFGEEGALRSEQEFRTWTGKQLEPWLEKEYFKRHITQFKRRPIAWHLSSSEGTFQTFVLYHKLSRATLERIRTLYAGALINRLRADRERAAGDSGLARELGLKIEDVEEFIDRLRAIEEGRTIEARIRCRWKDEEADGRPGPYAPDLDDGVKVNIRPFQEMNILARKVITKW